MFSMCNSFQSKWDISNIQNLKRKTVSKKKKKNKKKKEKIFLSNDLEREG
jgi:DNA topoisomerase IA